MTAEQKARDMLERMGVENAQSFSSGELVELANLISERSHLTAVAAWQERGQQLIERNGLDAMFALGAWWADRPWREETP